MVDQWCKKIYSLKIYQQYPKGNKKKTTEYKTKTLTFRKVKLFFNWVGPTNETTTTTSRGCH